jgi:hypothetical protein
VTNPRILGLSEISLIQHTISLRCSQKLQKLLACEIVQEVDCGRVSVEVWEWTLPLNPSPRVEFFYPEPSELLNNLDSVIERIIFHLQFQ